MIIEAVRINEYAVLKNIQFDFPKSGVIMVEGFNEEGGSNGVGKSALLECILWAFTGKTIRGTVPDNASVDVRFSYNGKSYTIERSGNSLKLYENGIRIEDTKTRTQEKIDAMLGISSKTLQLLTYFTPDTISKWFLSYSDTERKELFTEILDLSFLDRILEDVKKVYSNLDIKLSRISVSIEEKFNLIRNLESKVNPLLGEKASFEERLNQIVKEYELESSDKETLEKYLKKLAKLKENYTQTLYNIESDIRFLTSKKSQLFSSLSNIKNLTVCPTCLQSVPETHKTSVEIKIKQDVADIDAQINNLQQNLKETKEYLEFLQGVYNDINNILMKYGSFSSIDNQIELIETYKKEIELLKNELNETQEQVRKFKLLTDIFSPRGVKSYVISSVIELIGKYMEIYSSLMNLNSKVTIDDKGRISYSVDYKACSSGQKRRVEIALLFALRTVLPSPLNFIVIDEVFDHLDAVGIESANEVLTGPISSNFPIFIISHRSDFPIRFTERWTLRMKDGITSIFDRTVL